MQKLKDQVVVVTGGGRGIGKAIVRACAMEGAKVAIAARSQKEVENTAAEIRAELKVEVIGVACDVASMDQVVNLMETARAKLGPIDGVVAAAGIYGAIGPFDQIPFDEWSKAIDVNLLGTARTIHAVVPEMKKRKRGKIVLFSGGGQNGIANFSAYTTGKGGIWRLTETLGEELAPFGIFLNALAPGNVNTQFLDDLLAAGPEKVGKDLYERSLKQKQQGAYPPEKAAKLAVHLLSDLAEGLYGRTLSAIWDDYENIRDNRAVSRSDLYTMRRVVTEDGGTRPPK